MTQLQSLRNSNSQYQKLDSKMLNKKSSLNPSSEFKKSKTRIPSQVVKIQYLRRAFELFFKSQRHLEGEFRILRNNLAAENSKFAGKDAKKEKDKGLSRSIRATVKRHKSSFKKYDLEEEITSSKFFKLSVLVQSEIIPEEFLMDYERMLGLAAQVCVLHRDADTLDFLLTFYDCFLFFESQFRAAWAFYAIYLREFQEAISSLDLAIKSQPSHYMSLVSFTYIFLSGIGRIIYFLLVL